MKNFDPFFSAEVDPQLNARILKTAQAELEINRVAKSRQRFFAFLAPLSAILASFFVFKFVSRNEADLLALSSDQVEFIAELAGDEVDIEMLDNLSLLEEMEIIEDLEDV